MAGAGALRSVAVARGSEPVRVTGAPRSVQGPASGLVRDVPSKRRGVDRSVLVPLVLVHVAAVGLGPATARLDAVFVCVVLYVATGFGVTAGAHRLFTHRTFTPAPWLRDALAVAFLLAGQGSLHRWVRDHTMHHSHADRPGDPHSPTEGGFFWSHFGWLWTKPPSREEGRRLYERWTAGLDGGRAGRFFRSGTRLAILHASLAVALYTGGLCVDHVQGKALDLASARALAYVVWGIPVRIVLVMHATFLVNSACHLWGSRPYAVREEARNNVFVAAVALGEGWHNNHHAHPTAANQGFHRPWQFDPTFVLLVLLGRFGALSDLNVWRVAEGRLERWFPRSTSP